MGTISKDDKVIKIFYNSNTLNDNEAKSYFSSSDEMVLAIDTAKNSVTPTQWSQILEGLDEDPMDLINKNHDILKENNDLLENSFSMDNWLTIITQNPDIVIGIIAIVGEEYKYFKSPKSIIGFIADNADSAGITKS
jgi:arsenate reductase-like glutaredoxin family protein